MGQRLPPYQVLNQFNHQNPKHFTQQLVIFETKPPINPSCRTPGLQSWGTFWGIRWREGGHRHQSIMCCLVAALQWQEQRGAHRQVASNTNYKAAQVCWTELVALKCLCLSTVEEFSLVTVLTKQKKKSLLYWPSAGGGGVFGIFSDVSDYLRSLLTFVINLTAGTNWVNGLYSNGLLSFHEAEDHWSNWTEAPEKQSLS